jgi:protein tyrosine phosphatase
MLTEFVENDIIKANIYWPNNINEIITINSDIGSGYIIKNLSIENNNEYLVREFLIKKEGTNEGRLLYHYHYLKWGDSSIPSDNNSILNMIKHLNFKNKINNDSIVIHCSAGVGRTSIYSYPLFITI